MEWKQGYHPNQHAVAKRKALEQNIFKLNKPIKNLVYTKYR